MKLKIWALSLFIPFFISAGDYNSSENGSSIMSKDEALEFAKRRLDRLKETVNSHEGKNMLNLGNEIEKCFGTDINGRSMLDDAKCFQSDLQMLNIPDEGYCLTPVTYFERIAQYAKEYRDISFDYDIVGVEYTNKNQPIMSKSESPLYSYLHFKRIWMIDGKEIVIYETVQVDLLNKYISNISISKIKPNQGGGVVGNAIKYEKHVKDEKTSPSINKEPKVPNVRPQSIEMKRKLDELDMFANASYLYKEKKYSEAFELYKEITIKYPNNDEAWHALGAMYFKNEGVSLSRKQRLEKSAECFRKSKLKKSCRALAYVTDGREGCYK